MSIPVPLDELVAELGRRTMPAYVVTSAGTKAPHASAAFLVWDGTHLIAGCGNTMAGNLESQSAVAIIVPPEEPDGYSLIVDADGTIGERDGERVVLLRATHTVLHRPGPGSGGTGCGHDCKPLG